MAQIICKQAQGWAGIAEALKNAQEGDEFLIEAGYYSGDSTLEISVSGISIHAVDRVVLQYSGQENAISIDHCTNILISGLELEGDADNNAHGITAKNSESIVIQGCSVSGFTKDGINFSSSNGKIINNHCWNNGVGILLIRNSATLESPSKASILRNRCHDNALAGIVLSSSEAETIEENECWGNKDYGISLQRDSATPEYPSKASVLRNRCHDNAAQSGISLSSSEAKVIEENECWGNEDSGIILRRGSATPEYPSKASILRNRCHDNTQAGILLFSSEAEAIEENECWNNEISGISLQRGSATPESPSKASILRNRCHDNTKAGIALVSSEAKAIEGNKCWANKSDSIYADTHSKTNNYKELNDITKEDPEITQKRLQAAHPYSQQIQKMIPLGVKNPFQLSDFLLSGGCFHCFKRYWHNNKEMTPLVMSPQKEAVDALEKAMPHYAVLLGRNKQISIKHRAFKQDDDALKPQNNLQRALYQWLQDQEPGRWTLGLVSASDNALDQLFELLPLKDKQWQKILKEKTDEHHNVKYPEISTPLLIDYKGRTEERIETPGVSFMDNALLEGRSIIRERFFTPLSLPVSITGLLLTLFALPLLLLLLLIVIAEGFSYQGNLWATSLSEWQQLTQFDFNELLKWGHDIPLFFLLIALAMSLVTGLLLVIALINRSLPTVLRIQILWLETLLEKMSEVDVLGLGGFFKLLLQLLKQDNDQQKTLHRWKRWAGSRLFGHLRFGLWGKQVDGVIIGVKNISNWKAEDKKYLQALFELGNKKQDLLVITQMPGLSMVLNVYLDLWYKQKEGDSERSSTFKRAALLHDTQSSRLDCQNPCEPQDINKLETIKILSGIAKGQNLFNTLTDDRWTPQDILPALIIGSSHYAAMSIQKKDVDFASENHFLQEFWQALPEFWMLYDREKPPEIDSTAIQALLDHAETADGILRIEHLQERYIQLLGSSAYRVQLAETLRCKYIEGQNNDSQGYVFLSRLVACGELYNLDRIIATLKNTDSISHQYHILDSFEQLTLYMESALFLLGERLELNPIDFPVLAQRWLTLKGLVTQKLPERLLQGKMKSLWYSRFYCAFLGGAYLYEQTLTADIAPVCYTKIIDQLELDNFHSLSERFVSRQCSSISEFFIHEINFVLSRITSLDKKLATDLLEERLSQDWYYAPVAFKDQMLKLYKSMTASICSQLSAISDQQSLLNVVHYFSLRPDLLIAVLGLKAHRHAVAHNEKNGITKIAVALNRLSEAAREHNIQLHSLPVCQSHSDSDALVFVLLTQDQLAMEQLVQWIKQGSDSIKEIRNGLGRCEIEGLAMGVYGSANHLWDEGALQEIKLLA